ncbi:LysR substrate-binding domain-containing protein [Poseidonocella sp. HB161398]|uniref:LysR substrate-binding domain-containing protein n=1 Tax=Poseidonocella sp. HB161398 TaxID=2320855 RepID=UPI0011094753|nr:LysR substrate-binding domain-containing protein [Poseidonocella sp. HB161398]
MACWRPDTSARRPALRSSPTLPPLDSLRAFLAVARRGGFGKAGEELLISQSTVSHHIRKLEEMLGRPLFHRHAKSVSLTADGARLLEAAERGFALIEAAAAEIRRPETAGPLRVSLLPSFAANWLIARLGRFRDAPGGAEVQLDPTLDLAGIDEGEADLAIRYGARPEGRGVRLLFAEALCPAAAPGYAGPAIREPRDVLAHPLLDSRGSRDWRIWFEAQGLDLAEGRFFQLKDYNLVLEAMASGQGIGMARMRLIGEQIAAGRVRPCLAGAVSTEEAAHWLILPGSGARHPAAAAFADWILAETAGQRG